MSRLKMELIQINEAIDMITVVLDKQEDLALVEQLKELLKKRKDIIERLERIN